jgi:DNA polymerase
MDELRRHYLGLMGIDVWEARMPATPVEAAREAPAAEAQPSPVAEVATGVEGERLKGKGERLVKPTVPEPTKLPPEPEHPTIAEADVVSDRLDDNVSQATEKLLPFTADLSPAELDWDALQLRVSGCTACDELVANRTQTVFGVGNRQADLMVIGEAPGADEDAQGEPFVGRAGKLLTAMLAAIGLKREQVYIANVLKCRPPNNRDPKPEEAEACSAYLARQIALIQPKAILVVGRIAAQNLLHTDSPLGKLRGRLHHLENGVPVIVTYHPAYLLRSPREKRKAWVDLCTAVDILAGQTPGVGE